MTRDVFERRDAIAAIVWRIRDIIDDAKTAGMDEMADAMEFWLTDAQEAFEVAERDADAEAGAIASEMEHEYISMVRAG